MATIQQFIVTFGEPLNGGNQFIATYNDEQRSGFLDLTLTAEEFQEWSSYQGIPINKRYENILAPLDPTLTPEYVGSELFDCLFTGETKTMLDGAIAAAIKKDEYLQILLSFDKDSSSHTAIYSLPWEMMYYKSEQKFLCLHRNITIVRHVNCQSAQVANKSLDQLKILVVISEPNDVRLSKFNAVTHLKLFERLKNKDVISITILMPPTFDKLIQTVKDQEFNIIHFMGHAEYKSRVWGFYFQDSENYADFKPGQDLVLGLSNANIQNLRLVHFVSCDTARIDGEFDSEFRVIPFGGISKRVAKLTCSVIGMQFPIFQDDADAYVEHLYRYLACDTPMDLALDEARNYMLNSKNSVITWATPVLLTGTKMLPSFSGSRSNSNTDLKKVASLPERGFIPLSGQGSPSHWFALGKQERGKYRCCYKIKGNLLIIPMFPETTSTLILNQQDLLISISSAPAFHATGELVALRTKLNCIHLKLDYKVEKEPKMHEIYASAQQLLKSIEQIHHERTVHLVLDTYDELSFILGASMRNNDVKLYQRNAANPKYEEVVI